MSLPQLPSRVSPSNFLLDTLGACCPFLFTPLLPFLYPLFFVLTVPVWDLLFPGGVVRWWWRMRIPRRSRELEAGCACPGEPPPSPAAQQASTTHHQSCSPASLRYPVPGVLCPRVWPPWSKFSSARICATLLDIVIFPPSRCFRATQPFLHHIPWEDGRAVPASIPHPQTTVAQYKTMERTPSVQVSECVGGGRRRRSAKIESMMVDIVIYCNQ